MINQQRQLEIFYTLVQQESFTKAADILKISQVAVSKQIQQLEQQLNLQLIHRTTRYQGLTEAGQIYYEHCEKVLEQFAELNNAMGGMQQRPMGTLHVASTIEFASHNIIPYLNEFVSEYPEVKLELTLEERFPNLPKENIDIMLGAGEFDQLNLIRRRIAVSRYVLCASPEYLSKHPLDESGKQIRDHYYITHPVRKPDNLIYLNDGTVRQIMPALKINHIGGIISCIKAGMGIANLPLFAVEKNLADGSLVEVMKKWQQQPINIYLYYSQSKHIQPKIRAFIDFIISKTNTNL